MFAEVLKTGDDGEPAREFRDQSEGEQVGRLYARVEPVQHLLALALLDRDIPVGIRLRHDVVEPDERAAANEQNIGRIDVSPIGQFDSGAFHDLEQCVLDAFAGDAARLTVD